MKILALVLLIAAFEYVSTVDNKLEFFQEVHYEKEGEVNIIEVSEAEPKSDLELLKPYNVVIYKLIFKDSAYLVGNGKYVKGFYSLHYYQNEDGKLRGHKAWIGIKEQYDKGSYKWRSDTSVSIRLFHSVSGKEETHELFGHGTTSGILY